jgi:hypothetical protein
MICENLGKTNGDGYPWSAQKWATAAAVEFVTPAEPDNSVVSEINIS